ncbi:MAG: LacI family DNA-binding transcriptional regulator [Micrococcaceae bacterium]
MNSRSSVTLKALAEELGLNASTVSRVLNNPDTADARWASPETAQRILELARERGYSKNPYAASLRTAKSRMIGVVVPRLQDFVLATIYEGIDEAATERDYFTVVANSLDDQEAQRIKVEKLLDRRVDGLILGDALFEDPYLDDLKERGIPFVLVNRRSPGHVSVTCNDYEGGRIAAQHFLATGRRSFGVIAGDLRASTARDRLAGFRAALEEAGHTLPERQVVPGGFDADAGRAAAEELMDRGPLPDAVFAANDFSAIGAIGAFTQRGVRIPEDLALIGFNDTPLAPAVNLTTVRSPMHEMGRGGLLTLLDLLAQREVTSQQLAPDMVIRGTA